MDTKNTMMKKQIMEMLASVLLYSENGYNLVLDSLDFYRVSRFCKAINAIIFEFIIFLSMTFFGGCKVFHEC